MNLVQAHQHDNGRCSQYAKVFDSELMNDLFLVGATKPMGYLPLETIQSCHYQPPEVAGELERRELQTRFCSEQECNTGGGALYAWDRDALKFLLDRYKTLLEHYEWGTTPDAFVQNVIAKDAPHDLCPELYALVGKAFSDRRFKAWVLPEDSHVNFFQVSP